MERPAMPQRRGNVVAAARTTKVIATSPLPSCSPARSFAVGALSSDGDLVAQKAAAG